MADKISKEKRSKIMSSIRSKNTKIEVSLRKALWQTGIRGYRLHYDIPGKPDLVFPRTRIAIFIDGDFWHGYSWFVLKKVPPKGYWRNKIRGNMKRDKRVSIVLSKMGWTVIRFWEHEGKKNPAKCIKRIEKVLKLRDA